MRMKRRHILPALFAAVIALGSFAPVSAEPYTNDTEDETVYYYVDDEGQDIEIEGYDPDDTV